MRVKANGIEVELEDSGGEGRPVVLLIMGLGRQLIDWPDDFVQALVAAGYRVVCHDNRDSGLSQAFDEAGSSNLLWQSVRQRIGLPVRALYHLQDMADDSLGVLDALGIARAHVIGVSMGGMIAQRLAASAPQRALSLTSVMSSSGAPRLPGPKPKVSAALLRRPTDRSEAALIDYGLKFARLIESPVDRQADAVVVERLSRALRRAYRPAGVVRQILAIAADRDRAEMLQRIACPTLVLHGESDPLVPIACGRDTAARIPGARFVAVPGMGHDLPPAVVQILLQHILPFLQTVENAKRRP